MKVGVLALQGDAREHLAILSSLGVESFPVRRPEELACVDALVLPGGESTTIAMLVDSGGLRGALSAAVADGLPVLGTCAGMILMASELLDGRPRQWSLGAVDVAVRRNGYGRQVDSFEHPVALSGVEGPPVVAVFIRAPVIERVGAGVEVLARLPEIDGRPSHPVLVRQGSHVLASFHPELSGDARVHELFLSGVDPRRRPAAAVTPSAPQGG